MTSLSVVIPCYNDGAFLVEAIESVLKQDGSEALKLPDIEVLVVDDGSTEPDTLALLEKAPARWPNLRVIKNARKKGVSGARNQGIEASRGEWVAFLDADDIWLSDALLSRWGVVQEHPSAAWIAGDYSYWYPDGTLTPRDHTGKTSSTEILSQAFVTGQPVKLVRPVREFIQGGCFILPSSVMMKREILERISGFDESLSSAEDYEMSVRLSLAADLYFVPRCVFQHRQRTGSLSNRGGAPAVMERLFFSRLLSDSRFGAFRGEIKRKLASLSLENTYWYRQNGQWLGSVTSAAAIVRWQPFSPTGWKQLAAAVVGR